VYVISGVPRSWIQDVWIAVLAVGSHAVVSHETALLLHGVPARELPRYPIRLIVPHGQHHRIDGTVAYQRDDLAPNHVTEIGGLTVSQPARALVDVAARTGRRRLAGLLDDLIVASHTTMADVASCLSDVARPGKRGVDTLGTVLDSRRPAHTPAHSELERRLFAALSSAGLPAPVRQFPLPGHGPVEGFVDAAYPDAKMLMEADGRRWHTRVRDMKRDHARDAQASCAGWVTLRFVYEQLVSAPQEVAAVIAEARTTRLAQLGTHAA
jgi:hypothetical protein